MNNEQFLLICKGYKMIIDKIMSEGFHYKYKEVVKFENLKYKLEDIIYTNLATAEDYAYITTKLLGSESYFHMTLKLSKIDKRELMITRVENMLRDKDCNKIKIFEDGKIKFLLKRNEKGEWVDYKSVK